MIISNSHECKFVHIINKKEVSLNNIFQITDVKYVIYDVEDQMYYLLANKFEEKLGQFIVRFDENDPNMFQFLLRVKNKLDIGDSTLNVHRNP